MKNIHMNDMPLHAYIRDSLDNVKANGDDEFIHSIETYDINGLVDDLVCCDAGAELYVTQAPDYDTAVAEIKDIVTQWVKDQPNYDGSSQGSLF